MPVFSFSERSLRQLRDVHPDLISLAHYALTLTPVDFGITEGRRSPERQQALLKQGQSRTTNSRHLTGHAIDIIAYPTPAGSWEFTYYQLIADAFMQASVATGIPVEWGGNWEGLRDGPHFQLPWADYPL